MNKEFKPNGYNSVSPYFIINGASHFMDMLKELFGARELRRYDMPDGTIMHAEVQIDDSVIMIADASGEWPQNNHLMHVYVPDVDETFNKAVNMGCESVEPPNQKKGDPDRRGSFKDFAGNFWSVGTQVESGG